MWYIKRIFQKKYRKQIKLLKEKYNNSFKNEKNRTICVLNHDIKTPLLAQIQTLNLFLEEKFGNINSKQKEMLQEILNSNHFMLEIITNSLFLLQYENEKPKLNLEKIDVKDEIESAIENIQYFAKEKSQNIHLKINKNIKLLADRILIKKIIQNLLTSSLSYGFENSDVEISVKENKKEISFIAKNKSIYMTKEKINSLFQEQKKTLSDFNQLGMSLNLNIAKKLIKAHNWELIAKSKKNNSSVFGFVARK